MRGLGGKFLSADSMGNVAGLEKPSGYGRMAGGDQ